MYIVRRWFQILTYTNVVIALSAVAQCTLTYLIIDIPVRPYILVIEGCSTFLLYSFSLFLSKPTHPQSSPYTRTRFFFRYERTIWMASAFALCLLLYAICQIHPWTIVFLGLVGVLSLLYNAPVLLWGKTKVGVRQLPGLKLFYIAILWSLSTVGLPVVEAWSTGFSIPWDKANYLGVMKILFLVICTLPFDIRDMKQDHHYGLKTLPLMIGRQYAVRFTYILLLIHTALIFTAPYGFTAKSGLTVTNCFMFGILKSIFNNRDSAHDHVYLLDVALILQCVAVALMLWAGSF